MIPRPGWALRSRAVAHRQLQQFIVCLKIPEARLRLRRNSQGVG